VVVGLTCIEPSARPKCSADPAETRTSMRRFSPVRSIKGLSNPSELTHLLSPRKVLPRELTSWKTNELQNPIWEEGTISAETACLEKFAENLGADLFGVADLKFFQSYDGFDPSLLDFSFGISIGIRLSDSVIDRITVDDPTPEYASHYKAVNALLDDIALRITGRIQGNGYAALPIPASQITKPALHQGAISHKAIGAIAGLGWIGKNQLLINPRFGPRLRLASVLTTMPLRAGVPLGNGCRNCEVCIKSCPAHAIRLTDAPGRRWIREQVFDPDACNQRLAGFRDNPLYGVSICGICVKVCPFGRASKKKSAN